MKGQSGWERSVQERVWGEVAARREGRRRAAAGPGLCAEGGRVVMGGSAAGG